MESPREKNNKFLPELMFTVFLMCLFSLGALGVVLLGGDIYKNIVEKSNESFETRTAVSYVATKIRQGDERGMVEFKELDGVSAIVIASEIDGNRFEQWIYHSDGKIREITILEGVEFGIEDGFEIMEIKSLEFGLENGFIRLAAETEKGSESSLLVKLRT